MKSALRVYFDNAAAFQPDPKILGRYYAYAARFYENQEAAHSLAYKLRQKMELAAEQLANALLCKNAAVHWGCSGTGVFCLLGSFPGFKNGNIVTSPMEHPALTAALKRTGVEIREAKILRGRIDLEDLYEKLDRETVLTAIHHVQSETGIIQDLSAIRRVLDEKAPQSIFMSDTIQSAGKLEIPWTEAKLDIISVSGHKIGSAAAGALLLNRKKTQVNELAEYLKLCRGKYYSTSRPEPAAALALADGIARADKEKFKNLDQVNKINSFLHRELLNLKLSNNKKIIITVPPEVASPYILHFIVPGYQSGILVRMLSDESVYFSAGSACLSETGKPSAALIAMGFSKDDAYAGVRLSFSPQNTKKHAEIFLDKFQKALLNY
ncbi:MAG: aminotransferase class V-fold PLP-dependent enzyme [Victivallaceae bacterium]|nr:aminotransferase class V-fold PLP-dependent enzyme [Victivallaceae bacterium]